jgi:hypothetical protein
VLPAAFRQECALSQLMWYLYRLSFVLFSQMPIESKAYCRLIENFSFINTHDLQFTIPSITTHCI